ncbi:tRNA (guanosine(37)-N1)-methyltransferase TrmD [Gammaproteobacteria bacterium]|nr:tRNA (guanosine(37)-N1)-methyltransferase TrmD [Gammaproteobacteria bacterium]
MDIHAITLLPEIFQSLYLGLSGKALNTHSTLTTHQLRDFSKRADRRIDDRPFGGGPGMLISAEPVYQAKKYVRTLSPHTRFVFVDPKGKPFTQQDAKALAREPSITLVCGRYEGFDQRAYDPNDLTYSIGDFILTGGEIPACAIIDAILRLIPGTMGNPESHEKESFSAKRLEHPQYTRPFTWREQSAPPVLLSGNHNEIALWQKEQQLIHTWLKRPDLIPANQLTESEKKLIKQYLEKNRPPPQ